MRFSEQLLGSGERGAARRPALAAVMTALHAVATLDESLQNHPKQAAWLKFDREVALLAAVRDGGGRAADLVHILSARLGAKPLPYGHVALADLDARARRWDLVRQRKGPAELRALVAALAPARGTFDLVGLAEAIATELARCVSPSWRRGEDAEGREAIIVDHGGTGVYTVGAGNDTAPAVDSRIDAGDMALAIPYALRRLGATRLLLPSLSGRVKVFRHEHDQPLDALTLWAGTLAKQAGEGAARLRLLERYAADAAVKLAMVRRPQALRRLVWAGLGSWSLWAAQLARDTGVDVSSAWRSLEQAAELGLVMPVPTQRRSRGDGTLYAIPPWLQLAGLISVRPGRPGRVGQPASGTFIAGRGANGATAGAGGLDTAMAETGAAIAAIDALLASGGAR